MIAKVLTNRTIKEKDLMSGKKNRKKRKVIIFTKHCEFLIFFFFWIFLGQVTTVVESWICCHICQHVFHPTQRVPPPYRVSSSFCESNSIYLLEISFRRNLISFFFFNPPLTRTTQIPTDSRLIVEQESIMFICLTSYDGHWNGHRKAKDN